MPSESSVALGFPSHRPGPSPNPATRRPPCSHLHPISAPSTENQPKFPPTSTNSARLPSAFTQPCLKIW